MSVAVLFATITTRLLATDPRIETGRMLHAHGLKVSGAFFAFVVREHIVLKLPAAHVRALIAAGTGQPFANGRGVPMREWVRVISADEATCCFLVEKAHDFVAARQER
jgi:hypothetical protein